LLLSMNCLSPTAIIIVFLTRTLSFNLNAGTFFNRHQTCPIVIPQPNAKMIRK
jgi:hypothetical protein